MLDTSVDIKSGLSTMGHVDKYFGLVTRLYHDGFSML